MGGNASSQSRRVPSVSKPRRARNRYSYADFGSHAHTMATVDAPWNVTLWIDPLDPSPRVNSVPMLLVVRK